MLSLLCFKSKSCGFFFFFFACRAPSLASFAESISSIEEESEDNLWRIMPDQREYYTKQFRRLQPVQDGVVKGTVFGILVHTPCTNRTS